MTSFKPSSRAYAEDFADEPQHIEAARLAGERLGGRAMTAGTGAAVRMLAATRAARHVVEVGTGSGASGLWLLGGMPHDGVLTTIDINQERQRGARAAFLEAGYAPQRTRIISGPAATVLPRLADATYDLVLLDVEPEILPSCTEQALRLLRPGGVLAVDHMLLDDLVAEPTRRDPITMAVRALGKQLRADERLMTTLLPVGDGLLVSVRR